MRGWIDCKIDPAAESLKRSAHMPFAGVLLFFLCFFACLPVAAPVVMLLLSVFAFGMPAPGDRDMSFDDAEGGGFGTIVSPWGVPAWANALAGANDNRVAAIKSFFIFMSPVEGGKPITGQRWRSGHENKYA
ncbi:hypothetical protein [Afipia felis]|uniref:hypothetical protein n=1 Tax=Afipia felis TaxID=1035 RepID=UPI0006600363|nr:hypothetical protein [Afipia felis]